MDSFSDTAMPNYIELTAEIVAAYVAHNSIQRSDVPELISGIHASLAGLGKPAPAPKPERPVPPISVRKSIGEDYLISLEDGRRYKSLKRHLSGRGLTPQQYREKWSLPIDYPMVAPSYAKQRSDLAKSMGLGRRGRVTAAASAGRAAGGQGGRRGRAA